MRKKYFYSLLVLLMCPMMMWAEDWSKLGFKGKVISAKVYRNGNDWNYYEFTPEGKLTDLYINQQSFGSNFKISSSKIQSSIATVNLQNGNIKSTQREKEGFKVTFNYFYGKDNLLSKVMGKESWQTFAVKHISASSQMNASVAKAKKLLAQLKTLKPGTPAYKKIQAAYQAASKIASVDNVSGKNVKETKNHSREIDTEYFSDYKFDELGNWIERTVRINNQTIKEIQQITYEPEFLSDYYWTLTEKEGNLDKVEEFYMDTVKQTKTYRAKAYEYWNTHIMKDMAEKFNNQSEKLTHAASAEICSAENREKMLVIAREQIYQQKVLTERDYVQLRNISEKADRGLKVFNTEYQNKILARAQQMYEDSIVFLQNKIAQDLANKQFEEAQTTSLHALTIDSINETFLKQRAEAEYQLLMIKKENKTVTSDNYKQFRIDNPNSLYDAEIAELYKSKYTREKRGRFYHIGIAGDAAFGTSMYEATSGLGIRLGWHYSLINFYTGVQYGGFAVYSEGSSSDKEGEEQVKGGRFTGQHLTIPLMLRFNFARDFDKNFYVGLGANLNIATQGYLGYSDEEGKLHHFTDKKFYDKSTFFTPRLALGYSGSLIEIEVFALYELGDVMSKSLINSYIDSYPNYTFNRKSIDKQFRYRLSGGLALRLLF